MIYITLYEVFLLRNSITYYYVQCAYCLVENVFIRYSPVSSYERYLIAFLWWRQTSLITRHLHDPSYIVYFIIFQTGNFKSYSMFAWFTIIFYPLVYEPLNIKCFMYYYDDFCLLAKCYIIYLLLFIQR